MYSYEQKRNEPGFGAAHSDKRAASGSGVEELLAKSPRQQEQAQLQQALDGSPRVAAQAKRQRNTTGMPDTVKATMENAFQADFSDVKIDASSESAQEMGALAYARGREVHFAPGQFKPATAEGRRLLGHELAHVVQQAEGLVRPTTEIAGAPINDDPALEREADELGARAASEGSSSAQRQAGLQFDQAGEAGQKKDVLQGEPAQLVRLDPDKWSLSATRTKKQSIRTPKEWGETALHHKISKAVLSDLGEALEDELKKRRPSPEAQDFYRLIQKAAGGEVNAAVQGKPRPEQIVRILWNLPVNLELGPKNVAEDPGIGFDPNTELDTDSELQGTRRLTPESQFLSGIEQTFLANADNLEGEHWEMMTNLLRAAIEAHGAGTMIAEPRQEQWIPLDGERFVRRGLRSYRGLEYGEKQFSDVRSPPEIIAALKDDNVNNAYQATLNLPDGTPMQVNLSNGALYHIYTRHTYNFWDPGAAGAAKAVNTFWPAGHDIRERLAAELPRVLAAVGAAVAKQIPDTRDPGEFDVQDLSGVASALDGTFFYFAQVYLTPGPGAGVDAVVDVDTVAPSGRDAESYEPAELEKIGGRLPEV